MKIKHLILLVSLTLTSIQAAETDNELFQLLGSRRSFEKNDILNIMPDQYVPQFLEGSLLDEEYFKIKCHRIESDMSLSFTYKLFVNYAMEIFTQNFQNIKNKAAIHLMVNLVLLKISTPKTKP